MIRAFIQTLRPQFLLLSVVVVLLGTSAALYEGAQWSTLQFLALVAAAVMAHVMVNLLNEYQDFQSGLDQTTQRTPFSGGSGALVEYPSLAPAVFKASVVVGVLLLLLGGYWIVMKGWLLMPIGLIGLLLIVFYTSHITRSPWICLIAPGFAFGPLMVLGSYYIWLETISWPAITLSLVPFFLVNNLLLLNQVPDLKADQAVGRFNLWMRLGFNQTSRIFIAFELLAFTTIIVAVLMLSLPVWLSFALIMGLLAVKMVKLVVIAQENIEKLMPALAMNVIINLLTPLLLSLGLLLSL